MNATYTFSQNGNLGRPQVRIDIITSLSRLKSTLAVFSEFFHARDLAFPLAVFIVMRVWTIGWATLMLQLLPVQTDTARWYYGMMPLDASQFGWLWAPWQREDAIWYTAIATRGYASNDLSTAFFPLFPALIRAVTSLLPLNGIAAGLLISSAAGAGAFALFYRLVYKEAGRKTARRALIYLAAFPTAFFLFAVYTESLFLLLVLGAWWSGRNGRWGWACMCGGFAALTRAQGFLIVLPLAIMFWKLWRDGMAKRNSIINLAIPLTLPVIFMIYLSQLTGSFASWFVIEGLWRQAALPWDPLIESTRVILSGGDIALAFLNLLDLALTLLFLGVLLSRLRTQRWADAAYMAIILLPPLFAIARFVSDLPLASMSRFLIVVFPGFAWLGGMRLNRYFEQSILASSFALQALLLFLFTHWIFVG